MVSVTQAQCIPLGQLRWDQNSMAELGSGFQHRLTQQDPFLSSALSQNNCSMESVGSRP